jgi:hypothetical protein
MPMGEKFREFRGNCLEGATYNQPNGGPFVSGPLAWLQWQLQGDSTARAMFVGENCGFCSGSEWSLRTHFPD